ncbi:unnamed protein product [Arabis nemorensis]|uniref:Uncharacterized protein n=1 Tax=Arabis nemorensis TaxID=586526 RepID=A0A565CEQ5_9BRAS|nr:unnamed protein product [Arabis nemorensis]
MSSQSTVGGSDSSAVGRVLLLRFLCGRSFSRFVGSMDSGSSGWFVFSHGGTEVSSSLSVVSKIGWSLALLLLAFLDCAGGESHAW